VAVTGAVVLLLLAAYGAWAFLADDGGSSRATAARDTISPTQQLKLASQPSLQPGSLNRAQGAALDELLGLCAEHMKEMQPVMDQMMRDMMAGMMASMMGDGMMEGRMMGR
jgi:hypothetical protein